MFNEVKERNKIMKLKRVLLYLILIALIANSESLKVIFARNSTAHALKKAEADAALKKQQSDVMEGNIILVPSTCKPGFVFESTFHNRCRRIAG